MLEREEITNDWRDWSVRRLAWAMEGNLINYDEWDQHLSKLPEKPRKLLEEDIPVGLGYHEQTGYFVIASAGQGPCIGWIEKGD